jgi:hypothetical protein
MKPEFSITARVSNKSSVPCLYVISDKSKHAFFNHFLKIIYTEIIKLFITIVLLKVSCRRPRPEFGCRAKAKKFNVGRVLN